MLPSKAGHMMIMAVLNAERKFDIIHKEKGWRYANPFNEYGYQFIPLSLVLKQCIQSVITTLCFHR